MIDDAIAKSHKPNDLCQDCEIIGAGALNELYIKVTKNNIEKTIARINSSPSNKMCANISAIEKILPLEDEEKKSAELVSILKNQDRFDKIKIKLFKFDNDYDDLAMESYLETELSKLNISEKYYKKYGSLLEYLVIKDINSEQIDRIIKLQGIRNIDIFYEYNVGPTEKRTLMKTLNPMNITEGDTIIGVIDSGIIDNEIFEPFIIDRIEYVPLDYQNRSHGTFIASQILFGNELNHLNENNPIRFKIFDVIAIPNRDPNYGPIAALTQEELYEIIEEIMEQHSSKVKIWNLSLGNPAILAKDDMMSDLGVFCDYVQDKYNVQLIIAAGNYNEKPFRKWPPHDLGERDRINSPADSSRALVVGSIAQKDSDISLVESGEPSPFSRRGPGANYMVKPDVVDFGGNFDINGNFENLGNLGIDIDGNICEGIGTSYSTPLISYKYAKILDQLADGDLLLAKGLLIHDAKINNRVQGIEEDYIKYYGFGQASINCEEILNCSENEITLIFKQKVKKGTHLSMEDFPFPNCLCQNGKYKGEIYMTLIYNPLLNQNYGAEYIRINFDASFGTYKKDAMGKPIFKGQVPLEKNWDDMYERSRVMNGFKWSPIKSYYRNLKNGIKIADGWKIRIDMNARNNMNVLSQEFLLIVTIRGDKNAPVYNDVVQELKDKGYITINLETKQQIRGRN